MTESELDELLNDCPTLYHMAERESWTSIRESGLLGTTALLDRYGVEGAARFAIEAQRRPVGVVLNESDGGRVVVRDQAPMGDRSHCLEGDVPRPMLSPFVSPDCQRGRSPLMFTE